MDESHPLVQLARRTIEVYVQTGEQIPPPEKLTPEMFECAGVFVSLHRRGMLRGCVGTIVATHANVAEEIIHYAILAATCDTRFERLRPDELDGLDVKVDVLTKPEPVHSLAELDPKRYGLIVQSLRDPSCRGLLLPDLEGVDTVEKQVYYTRCHKADIHDPDEPVRMYRFEVRRYT